MKRLKISAENLSNAPIPEQVQVEHFRAPGGIRDVEWLVRTKSDVIPPGRTSAGLIAIDHEPCVLAATADITTFKGMELALQESEARFRLVANTAPLLIWMSGPDKLCTYFNKPWLDFTGRPIEAELGNGWAAGIHPQDLKARLGTYARAFDDRQSFKMQYRLRRHDGEYRWISDIGVPRFNADESLAGYIGSCTDITEQRLAQETLNKLSGKLIEAQENERSRIARELHDDICQRLIVLSLEIEHSMGNPDGAAAKARGMQEIWEHCSKLASDVQALSHELHSSMLDHLGMTAAVKNFCSEFSKQQGVVVEFTHVDVPRRLPQSISLCLFRVVQEALRNAVKHSGVSFFEVHLQGAPDGIELEICDGGMGCDLEQVKDTGGLGLISMQERVHLVKGTFAVDSKADSGTKVRAWVPWGKNRSTARTASEKMKPQEAESPGTRKNRAA